MSFRAQWLPCLPAIALLSSTFTLRAVHEIRAHQAVSQSSSQTYYRVFYMPAAVRRDTVIKTTPHNVTVVGKTSKQDTTVDIHLSDGTTALMLQQAADTVRVGEILSVVDHPYSVLSRVDAKTHPVGWLVTKDNS